MNCLDDELVPADWYAMLNRRVFFWVDKDRRDRFRQARAHQGRDRLVLELDTLSVARQYGEQMELSPINSGSGGRPPARRGLSTFTPLLDYDYATWRRLRRDVNSSPDHIVEVTVVEGIENITDHVIEHYMKTGSNVPELD